MIINIFIDNDLERSETELNSIKNEETNFTSQSDITDCLKQYKNDLTDDELTSNSLNKLNLLRNDEYLSQLKKESNSLNDFENNSTFEDIPGLLED